MQAPSPTTTNRYLSLDFLRGVAILGILLMNIQAFAFPESAALHQVTDLSGMSYKLFAFNTVFAEGTMRGLFSMLFGASCLLINSKSNDLASADVYYRRLIWLFMFGLSDAYILLWHGDILYAYAFAGLFLFPFRNVKPKYLIAFAMLLSIGIFGRSAYRYAVHRKPVYTAYKIAMNDSVNLKKPLTEKQRVDVNKFLENTKWLNKDTAAINEEIKTMRGSYKEIYNKRWVDGEIGQKLTIYNIPHFWDPLLMMFLGMAFYKLGVFTNKLKDKHYAWMVIIGYAIGLFLNIRWFNSFYYSFDALKDFYETYTIPTGSYTDFARIALTVGHVGLLMLIYRNGFFRWLVKLLANTGRMAFSNYLLQSILCGLYFYGFGLGKYGSLRYGQAILFVMAIWVISIVLSNIWLRFFKFGPFEWLWRSLTYWKIQPMRK